MQTLVDNPFEVLLSKILKGNQMHNRDNLL